MSRKPDQNAVLYTGLHAVAAIDTCEDGMALFMLGGRVLSMKRTSRHFDDNVAWMASDLIGVYDCGADNRCVKDDLLEFYSIKRA